MLLRKRLYLAGCCVLVAVVAACGGPTPKPTSPRPSTEAQVPAKAAVATGVDGGVSSVNPYATGVGIDVLTAGGNAVDAAVATAAALGVVEPYSAGIGGGGYLVYYDARSRQVFTLDGRETAPTLMNRDSFLDPVTKQPLPFDQAVTSGLSVGVPGTPATWGHALRAWGTISLAQALAPATKLAQDGFVVSQQFRGETEMNAQRFRAISSTAQLYLPGGNPPEVGSVLRNPDLAATYRLLAKDGVGAMYRGPLAEDIVRAVQQPPVAAGTDRQVRPGLLQAYDLASYSVSQQPPTHSTYHGIDLYGMAPSSSGGTTVGEALNILSNYSLTSADPAQAVHHMLEASRIAFADRNRWVGDPSLEQVPVEKLLSPEFGKDRACLISPTVALTSPVPAGDPNKPTAGCPRVGAPAGPGHEGPSTTHLVTADKWGNVVSYTLTIEQTGGSAITVPNRGFLLNNELSDFNFTPVTAGVPDPNLPGSGKRPRSSMSPMILIKDGKPMMAIGSPGGASIITTVLQTLVNRLDLGMSLPDAIAAPRLSQRNAVNTEAEPAFGSSPVRAELERLGHHFVAAPPTFSPAREIGAVEALEFLPDGRIQVAAEPSRRGGGAASVVTPRS